MGTYTRRLPTLLRQCLAVECELSYHQTLFDMREASHKCHNLKREVYVKGMRHFCQKLDTPNARALYLEFKDPYWFKIADEMLLLAACNVGDVTTIEVLSRMVEEKTWYTFWKIATLYQHWDVLDLLLPKDTGRFQHASTNYLAVTSVPAMHYYESRYGPVLLSPNNLRRCIVDICYTRGFDSELLDLAFQRAPLDNNASVNELVALVEFPHDNLHPSALETVKYVLGKYPHLKLNLEHYRQITQLLIIHPHVLEIVEGLRGILDN